MKLTDKQVMEIRKAYLVPKYVRPTMMQLARRYGVCSASISDVITFQSHKTTNTEAKAYREELWKFNRVSKSVHHKKGACITSLLCFSSDHNRLKIHLMKRSATEFVRATTACGIIQAGHLIYPRQEIAAYMDSEDVCKTCKKCYNKTE